MNRTVLLLLAGILATSRALAHGGEDHGDAPHPPAAAVAEGTPRGAAATEDLEVVALVEAGHLVLYVDRYATNEPVADARVEVEGNGLKGLASPVAPGVYRLPAPSLAQPGRHLLSISVEAADLADLLTLQVPGTMPDPPPAHVHSRDEWLAWAAAGLLLAGGGLAVWLRRRRTRSAP